MPFFMLAPVQRIISFTRCHLPPPFQSSSHKSLLLHEAFVGFNQWKVQVRKAPYFYRIQKNVAVYLAGSGERQWCDSQTATTKPASSLTTRLQSGIRTLSHDIGDASSILCLVQSGAWISTELLYLPEKFTGKCAIRNYSLESLPTPPLGVTPHCIKYVPSQKDQVKKCGMVLEMGD